MRVIFDARVIGPELPGIGRATRGLLHGLTQAEHDHRLTVLHLPRHRDLLNDVAADARFALRALDVEPYGFLAQQRVARIADADLWHAPYFVRPLRVRRSVVTAYDLIHPVTGAWKWRWKMRMSLRAASRIVAISAATRDALVSQLGIDASRIDVVPLGVTPRAAATPAASRYVLYLGNNKPHKNVGALVRAWKRLAPKDVELVLAGREDPRFPSHRELYGDVARCIGDVSEEELPALLGGALCFVFPSLHEGFGLPPLEAMACGTPVVASNRTSIPEVVADAGILVEPDEEGIAEGLRRVLESSTLRGELRQRGLARAAQFTWKRTAELTLAAWERA
ncbi:MAG TPA: glycosyltransferase family 1 protein [Thermoanaerobaculia bacterium]|nr:glycosyltransferase family 1 protein [Thermoanaerobaculia bacterium]